MFFSLKRFPTLFTFIVCFAMFAHMVFAIEIELPLNTILLEAEAGEMDGGVTVVEQDGASEGKAIDSAAEALTQHEIILPVDGDWYIWVRLWCPDGGQDSYWFGMDDALAVPDDGGGQVRIYSAIGDSVNTNDQPFNIWFWDFGKDNSSEHSYFDVGDPGTQNFWSKGREPGTLLDQILLTKDADFNPEEASQGEAITINEAVHPESKLAVTWGKVKDL